MSGPFDPAVGTVVAFDEHRGYGQVCDADGTTWTFHCTSIAGGRRSIDIGTAVHFEVRPGRRGDWEAVDLRLDSPAGL